MVLTSDHVTPGTGLTVTAQRLIDSGVYTAVSGNMTEVSNGTYRLDYLAADCNGDDFVTAGDSQTIFAMIFGMDQCVDTF